MRTRYVHGLTIRPLRNGDTATVEELFGRLGAQSRARRFCGAKPRLSAAELAALARVDETHHVLVAYLDGEAAPAGMARLVRAGAAGEIAFEVADVHQGRGIGSVLARELAADARAAGITELVATVCGDNEPAVSLLRRIAHRLDTRWRGGERELALSLGRLDASPHGARQDSRRRPAPESRRAYATSWTASTPGSWQSRQRAS